MSNELKKSLINKMDIKPSSGFDAAFFDKLEKSKKRPSVFSNWITWAVSGCATASVLFIAINNYNTQRPSFNHQEYVESVLEIQRSMSEEIVNEDMDDLTIIPSDEI